MNRDRKVHSFWISFSDLMTSLFFVVLVLYVLTFIKLKKEQERYKADADQLRKINEIENSIKLLGEKKHFFYQQEFKRYQLKRMIQFKVGSDIIPINDYDALFEAGKEIEEVIENAKVFNYFKIKYLILIEGMSSKDRPQDELFDYRLSYLRALSIYKFWEQNGIKFDPEICEVQITGSGWRGVGRDNQKEDNNRRILIQIIPKVSK